MFNTFNISAVSNVEEKHRPHSSVLIWAAHMLSIFLHVICPSSDVFLCIELCFTFFAFLKSVRKISHGSAAEFASCRSLLHG